MLVIIPCGLFCWDAEIFILSFQLLKFCRKNQFSISCERESGDDKQNFISRKDESAHVRKQCQDSCVFQMVLMVTAATGRQKKMLIISAAFLYLTGCHWIYWTVEFFWIHLFQLQNYEKDTKLRKTYDGVKLQGMQWRSFSNSRFRWGGERGTWKADRAAH